jgi:hypothetical protein
LLVLSVVHATEGRMRRSAREVSEARRGPIAWRCSASANGKVSETAKTVPSYARLITQTRTECSSVTGGKHAQVAIGAGILTGFAGGGCSTTSRIRSTKLPMGETATDENRLIGTATILAESRSRGGQRTLRAPRSICPRGKLINRIAVTPIPTAAAPSTAVASQPTMRRALSP